MRPTGGKPMRGWGTAYVGTGDLEVARRAVEKALAGAGMACRTTRIGEQCVLVEGKQQASWHRILLHMLLQRVQWRIESSGGALRLSSDFRLFRWYSAVLILLCVVIASCFVFDYLNTEKGWLIGPAGTLVAGGLVALSVGLMLVVIHLLGALGGRSSERLWLSVVHEMEQRGGRLGPQGNPGLRTSLYLLSFFAFALALSLWFVTYSLRSASLPLPGGVTGFLAVLGCLMALLIVTLVLMLGRRGFTLRLYPIITGLMTMLSALFLLLTILLPWWMTSGVNYGALGAALRPFGWLLSGGSTVLAAAVAYVFFYYVIYSTPAIRPQMIRLQSHGEAGAYRLAVGGESPLPFQIVFFLTWLLLTGLILAGLAYLVACAVEGVVPLFEPGELQLVHLSSQAITAVLGLAPGNRLLSVLVPGIWVLFALVGVGLLLASTGSLFWGRRALRRRLAAAAEHPFPRRRELEEMLEEMCRMCHLPPIRLALRAGDPGEAWSERFGVWRVERYVEISERSLDLPAAKLRAAVAHEYAHHHLGHLTIRSCALWLGRLSLTGDGFVFALLDSFGYEKQADRAAVQILGTAREGLEEFLQDLIKRAQEKEKDRVPEPPMTSLRPPFAYRWSLFLEQYCGGLKHHYWHPVAQERLEALRGFD